MGQFGETVDNSDLEGDYSKKAADERQRREHQMFKDKVDQYGLDSDQAQAQLGAIGRTYVNPGAADYGGSPEAAGFYKDQARQGMASNDAQQAATQRGLAGAYAGMMNGNRGPQAQENAVLSGRESGTRGKQLEALGLMGNAAAGGAPSAARYQTNIGMQDALSAYVGGQGGMRGLSGLSGGNTAGGTALGHAGGNIAAAGGQARSNEIIQEIGNYGKTAGQTRGQDLTRLGIGNQMAQFNAGLNNDYQLGQAGLAAGYTNLANQQDGMDQRWMAESMRPDAIQFQMDQEAAGWQAGQSAEQAALALERERDQKNAMGGLIGGIAQAGLTAIGSLAGPGGAALGGMAGSAIGAATKKYY